MWKPICLFVLVLLAAGCGGETELYFVRGESALIEMSPRKGTHRMKRLYSPMEDTGQREHGGVQFKKEYSHRFGSYLIIESRIHVTGIWGAFYGKGEAGWLLGAKFSPFDAVRLELYERTGTTWALLDVEVANDHTGMDAKEIIARWKADPPPLDENATADTLLPVADRAVVDMLKSTPTKREEARRIAGELLEKSPEDPLLLSYALELALVDDDVAEASAHLERLQRNAPTTSTTFFTLAMPHYVRGVETSRRKATGPTVAARIGWLPPELGTEGPTVDHSHILAVLAAATSEDIFLGESPTFLATETIPKPVRFFEVQMFAKVCRVLAEFDFLNGNPQEGLKNLLLANRLAALQTMPHEADITRLIGIAIFAITNRGIENILLSVDQPDIIAEIFAQLAPRYGEYDTTGSDLDPPLWRMGNIALHEMGSRSAFMADQEVRHGVSRALGALTLAGTAARHQQLVTGRMPTTPIKTLLLMPEGLPTDPFSADGAVLHAASAGEGLRFHSIGPDRIDDLAVVEYDPTNGTVSSGDVILNLPAQRQFPAITGKPLPGTRDEILAQFPRGLPPDPFSDKRGLGYVITDESPARIFSWGPDVDLQRAGFGEGMPMPSSLPEGESIAIFTTESDRVVVRLGVVPEVPYDPSNGTLSDGDLILGR